MSIDLCALSKQLNATRVVINHTDIGDSARYLCEVWADDVKFVCGRGANLQAAVNRAVAKLRKLRNNLEKEMQS